MVLTSKKLKEQITKNAINIEDLEENCFIIPKQENPRRAKLPGKSQATDSIRHLNKSLQTVLNKAIKNLPTKDENTLYQKLMQMVDDGTETEKRE